MTAPPAFRVVASFIAAAVVFLATVEGAITFGDQPPPLEPPPPKPGQKQTLVAMPLGIAADAANKESLNALATTASNNSLASTVTFALPAFMLIFGVLALFAGPTIEKRKRHRIVRSVAAPRGLMPHAPFARTGSGVARRRE